MSEAQPSGPPVEQLGARQQIADQLAARMTDAKGLAGTLGAGGGAPSVLAAMGGVRGLLESVIPITVFSAVYGITRDLQASIVAALVPAVALSLWRIVAREPLTQAVGGLFGIGIGAFIALRTGRAEDFFLPSILKNLFFALVYAISVLLRWPLIGLLLGFFLGEGTAWREVPARRRAYSQATWLWSGMFGLRVAVQTPLYLAGMTAVLGGVNVGLGLPLFALTIWGSYLLVRRVPVVHVPPEEVAQDDMRDDDPKDDPSLTGAAPD